MAINGLSNNLHYQYSRSSNITEKANAIYAKLNEEEQSFLDKDTIEKALQQIAESRANTNKSSFSLQNDANEIIDGQGVIPNKQYELANELAIRIQANDGKPEKRPQAYNLRVDDVGVLVSDADTINQKPKATSSAQINDKEALSLEANVKRHVSLTA